MSPRVYTRRPVAERFWEKVDRRGPDECWPWLGSRNEHGYGKLNIQDDFIDRAHRVSYELAYGPFVRTLDVLHHCDNPPCVNPTHLYLGTAKDNSRDMMARGRWTPHEPRRGEANNKAKLTAGDVLEIRRLYRKRGTPGFLYGVNGSETIGKIFGVSGHTIRRVVGGLTWTHL